MDRIAPADDEWHFSRLALSRTGAWRLTAMHRITVTIDHPWIPSALIPGSGDSRPLGLQIGAVELR